MRIGSLMNGTNDPVALHKILVSILGYSKHSFVAIGKVLKELKKEDAFKKITGSGGSGETLDRWEGYLGLKEIGLTPGEAARLIRIYDEFVVRLGYDEDTIAAIPVKNIHYLLPIIKKMDSREEADELVADATLMSQRDFKELVYELKKKAAGEKAVRTYEYIVMKKTMETGTMSRVNIASDNIKEKLELE